MNKKDDTNKCEICGKAGSLFVVLGQKGSNDVDFYWICKTCNKAIKWVLARMNELEKEKYENNPEEQK